MTTATVISIIGTALFAAVVIGGGCLVWRRDGRFGIAGYLLDLILQTFI